MNKLSKIIYDYDTKKFFCIHKKYKDLCGKCTIKLLQPKLLNEKRRKKERGARK